MASATTCQQRFPNPLSRIARSFVLPDTEREPTRSDEFGVRIPVATLVARDLLRPIPRVVTDRAPSVKRTAVPEASVDEHRHSGCRKHQVCGSSECRHGAAMNEVPQAQSVGSLTYGELRRGACAPLRLHTASRRAARRERALRDPRRARRRPSRVLLHCHTPCLLSSSCAGAGEISSGQQVSSAFSAARACVRSRTPPTRLVP